MRWALYFYSVGILVLAIIFHQIGRGQKLTDLADMNNSWEDL